MVTPAIQVVGEKHKTGALTFEKKKRKKSSGVYTYVERGSYGLVYVNEGGRHTAPSTYNNIAEVDMLGVALRISNFFVSSSCYSSITARTESWADMETPLNVNHALAYIHTHIQAAIYNSLCVLSEGERERDM